MENNEIIEKMNNQAKKEEDEEEVPPVKLTKDGKVKKQIIKHGLNNQVPQIGQIVSGTLPNGQEFDRQQDREKAFKFQLGRKEVIAAWELCIGSMQKEEICILETSAEYAYGEKGLGKEIPPNSSLKFSIELLDFYDRDDKKLEHTISERTQLAEFFKKEGNEFFQQKRFEDALKKYQQAEDYLDFTGHNEDQVNLLQSIYLNLSAVYLKMGDYIQCIDNACKVINYQNNTKAFYRRAQARKNLGLYEDALLDLQAILQLEKDNKEAMLEIQAIKQLQKKSDMKEKQIYSKLFSQQFYTSSQTMEYSDPSNPIVFLDIQIGDQPPERVEIELFKNHNPMTSENFRALCTGEKGKAKTFDGNLHYKSTVFHRLNKNFMIQGGDIQNLNGKGGESIYGKTFHDENFKLKHIQKGIVSMSNTGRDTNSSQFFITFKQTKWLDGVHVVFGFICKNIEFLDKLKEAETEGEKPVQTIKIVDCGEVLKK